VLVIDKMGEIAMTTEDSLKEIRSAVDLLHGRLAIIDTTEQSLVAQLGLISDAIKDGAVKHAEAVRYFASLDERLTASTQAMERLRVRLPEEDDPDPDAVGGAVQGKGTLRPAQVTWTGNSPGASSASQAAGAHVSDDLVAPRPGMHGSRAGGAGFQGGGVRSGVSGSILGGAGGGGLGGAGGSRTPSVSDQATKHNLKMSFPKFDGENPGIWQDKCLDYFRLFNVHPSL
jgi:hypothetical protein